MKVQELIERLQEFDGGLDIKVYVFADNPNLSGYLDITDLGEDGVTEGVTLETEAY
jgi:hypothetical protein